MSKIFSKSKNESWDDIARRVYGTPEKGGDIAKLNNNIEEGEVLVLDDETSSSNSSETKEKISISCGSVNYDSFSEYTLFDGLEAVKGAVFIFNKTDIDYNFSFKDSVEVFDEEGSFLKGRIANIKSCLNERANWIQVEVKSHAGILTESVMPNPFEFVSCSVKSVLEQTAGYYNQKIEFSGEAELDEVFANEIGTSFTARKEETVWEFMKRICHSRGLLITDTGDGLFIGRYNPNTQEKLNLIYGECLGLKEIRAEFITVGLGRYYELNSQYPSTDTSTAQIPFPAPIIKRYDSNDFNALGLSDMSKRTACMEIGKAFKVYALLSEDLNFKSGNFAVVKNEKINISKETDFVIEGIERRHPDETFLVLTLPCAYTYEIPDELPLC